MVNNELDRVWKDAVVSLVEVLSRRLPGTIESTKSPHADVPAETACKNKVLPLSQLARYTHSPEGHSLILTTLRTSGHV
jgi:hypothetical protein